MLFSIEGELESEQVEEVEESISNKLQGSSNAGRPLITNSKTTVHQLSQNIKDMDFAGLKKDTMTAIYNCLKIPLAMISQDSSTFNNLESSRYNFYDNTIIPLVQVTYNHLTNNVLKRYPDSENLELTFDPSKIDAISRRRKIEVREDYKNGLLTRNEARSKIGELSIGNQGDVFYQPMNLVPVGTDPNTTDNRESNSKRLIDTMTQLKDDEGKPFYNAKEIIKAVKEIENGS
jgi:HK97 family phage portal protein